MRSILFSPPKDYLIFLKKAHKINSNEDEENQPSTGIRRKIMT